MPKVYVVSAFTHNGKGGNLAGVVFDPVSDTEKQLIAKTLGYSETVFVENNRFRYFTPNSEIDFCGHATLAALSLLDFTELDIELNNFTVKAFKEPLMFNADAGEVIEVEFNQQEVLESLGIESSDVDKEGFNIIYTGLKDLFVHVKDVNKLKPNFEMISTISQKLDIVGYHVYQDHPEYDATTRNFAPLYGINEESATGSANSGLAYLKSLQKNQKKYQFLQGEAMNKKSEIIVYIDNGIYISGEATLIETLSVLEDKNVKA